MKSVIVFVLVLISVMMPLTMVAQPDIKILLPGSYHGDEVNSDLKKLHWYGLFEDELRSVELIIDLVEDPLFDEPGQRTGKSVKITGEESPFFLISGPDFSQKQKINGKTFTGEQQILYPGQRKNFQLGKTNYSLSAYGTYNREAFNNYQLVLSAYKNGKYLEQVVAAGEHFDDTIFRLLWFGDLDNDQQLDILMDTSSHYNVNEITLFLSSFAQADEHVKKVTSFQTVGC